MAVIRSFELKELRSSTIHSEAEATISMIDTTDEKFIQIDTYGSKERAIPGKTSQSLRLSKAAFDELVKHGLKHF